MSAEEYHTLLYKQQLEGLSADESDALGKWLQESEEHRRIADEVEAVFHASATHTPSVDVEAELRAFKTRLGLAEADAQPHPAPLAVTHRAFARWGWAAAAAAALIATAVLFFRKNPSSPPDTWVVISSEAQQSHPTELPDGSRVWLHHPSTLRYVASFAGHSERHVELSGEAFFEVEKDAARPFTIAAGPCEVRVLGTSFNVRALPGSPTCEVEVSTGRVRLSGPAAGSGMATADLEPGQRGVYRSKEGQLSTHAQERGPIAEWRQADMAFQRAPLGEVMERLSRRFGQPIVLENEALASCEYSAYFPRADLSEVLTNLRSVFGVSPEKSASGYRLRGGRCPK
ncbi:MAG TPA: FecR domain-containing protein [Saprospiraceae bacterium]|nr:FecR domain-containing protein [Saprospiraceae bacterium]